MKNFALSFFTILSVILLIPSLPAVSSTSGGSPAVSFAPIIFVGPQLAPSTANAPTPASSSNWAGYAVAAGANSVTNVVGSWVQPAITCNSKGSTDQDASFWMGIDGFGSFTVEQTGTAGFCLKGATTPTYQAWYEFYPDIQKTYAAFAIHPGDVIQASVTYTPATHTFKTLLKDVTTGKFRSSSAKSTSDLRSSAECIAEAPSEPSGILPLARFTKALFGADHTAVAGSCFATINGHTKGMGAFSSGVYEITMLQQKNGITRKATPSSLTHSDSFSVTWNSAGP